MNAQPITIRVDDLNATTRNLAEQALPALAKREVYQRAASLVHVVREPVNVDGVARATGSPHIRGLPRQLLVNELSEAADWIKSVASGGSMLDETTAPPKDVVSTIIEAGQWEHVRPLRAIANWPTLRPDGGIAMTDGYDPSSRYLLCDVPRIELPQAPTQAHAHEAATALLELVSEFPIESAAGRSVWLASVLTLLARPAITGPVPCVLFNAPTPGSGKTLLAQSAAALVTGAQPTVRAAPQDNAEWNRSLLAIALGGDPVCLLDNLRGKVESGAFEAVLTSASYSDRKLRGSEDIKADVQTLFLLTGNNAEFTVDLARRALECRLVPVLERPEMKGGFKIPRLVDYVIAHRPALLRAALTIFHAYRLAGSPGAPMRPMGSFEAWSDAVRAPMIWAGCTDPAETQDGLRESASAELDDRRAVLEAWRECFGDRAVSVRAAMNAIAEHQTEEPFTRLGCAFLALCDVSDPAKLEPRAIGDKLKPLKDRVLGVLALQKDGKDKHGTLWRVASLAAG